MTTVSTNNVLTKFQKWLLGESELPEGDADRYGSGPRALARGNAAPDLGELESRLCKLLSEQPTVTAGRIFFIDLESLRVELADQWPNLADVIESVSRTVFRRNLSANDVYCKYGDDGFLVVFSTLSTASATVVCQRIADDLRAMLMGKTGSSKVSVRTVVGQRDSRLLMQEVSLLDSAIRVARNDETEAAQVHAPNTGQTSTVAPMRPVAGLLDSDPGWNQLPWQAGAETDTSDAPAPARQPAPRVVSDEPGWEPLQIERSARGNLPRQKATEDLGLTGSPDYLFQPVWDTQNKLLSTYLCLTPDEVASEPTCIAAGGDLGSVDGDAVAAFDLNKLLNAADMLDELVRNYFQLFVSAAVHAETMGTPRHRRQYLHVVRRIPEKLRKYLIFQLYGLPAGITTSRIVDCVTALRPYCGAILVETGLDPAEVSRFAGIGIHAVGADLRTVSPSEQRLFGDLSRFAAEADKHRLWTFLTGITKSSQVIGATAAGIRYLSGRRIGPASEVPMHIRQFNLEDFYRGLVSDRG